MRISIIACIILFTGIAQSLYAQERRVEKYRNFDKKIVHFGFMLGFNTSDFTTYQNLNNYQNFGIKQIENIRQPGGQVGIVTTLKLGTPVLRLRFIPTLSFQERLLNFYYDNPIATQSFDLVKEQRVNSTNLNFPLMFQVRTLRTNNFAAYTLFGAQYSLDLQSQQDAAQDFLNPFIKIKKHDYAYQIGGGVEFFARFFKFGLELKYSHGFNNVLIQDNTNVSLPFDHLRNRVWWISLIFEG